MEMIGEEGTSLHGSGRWQLVAAGLFVAIQLIAPFTLGERYPFTISPMFQDQPGEYCLYEVLGPEGERLDPRPWGLHLVYDGNPPGLGVGLRPTPTLHSFGEVASEAEIAEWIQPRLKAQGREQVTVRQTVVRPAGYRLTEESREWTISRESSE